jgi:RNA polymerase sigma factor (sigma-70 family)
MTRPDYILALDRKAGKEWTQSEIRRSMRWWMDRDQERLIWLAAFRYLGLGVATEDIEEAWVTFYAEELEKSRKSYRPGGPDYATYAVHVCFKRECIRRGEEIRKRGRSTVSLYAEMGETGPYDREIASTGPDPQTLVEQKALIGEIVNFLETSTMPPRHKRAFVLKHFDGKSNEEIASELSAEVGTVKVWAHRAAVRVQEHLRRKEWVN